MNDSSLGVYFLRGYGIRGGGQQKARAIAEFRFFVEVSYEAFCRAWSKPKKKKNWPGVDDKWMRMARKHRPPRRLIPPRDCGVSLEQ